MATTRYLCDTCWAALDSARVDVCPECQAPRPEGGWFRLGTLFAGRFRLTEVLGRGGLGVVFLAHEASDPARRYAVKLARRDGSEPIKAIKAACLQFEIRVHTRVESSRHFPSIAASSLVDPVFLAMAHVSWPTLHHVLQERGHLSEGQVVRLGLELLRGVLKLHDRDLVHRDLTPKNVFAKLGDDGRVEVMILDLGGAVDLYEAPDGSLGHLTPPIATPGYASPQQLAQEPPDPRDDVYAIGAILWKAATGRRPPKTPRIQVDPNAPLGSLLAVLARALDHDRSRRPYAKDLGQQLGALVAGATRRDLGAQLDAVIQRVAPVAAWHAELLALRDDVEFADEEELRDYERRIALAAPTSVETCVTAARKLGWSPPTPPLPPAPPGRGRPWRSFTVALLLGLGVGALGVWALSGTSAQAEGDVEPAPVAAAGSDSEAGPAPEADTAEVDTMPAPELPTPAPPSEGERQVTLLPGDVALAWRWLPAGSFDMGSENGGSDEKPIHKVTFTTGRWIGESEVTVRQYTACVDRGPCTKPKETYEGCTFAKAGLSEHPVNCVDWKQAKTFCEWKALGGRLPTEAEWEYAARSGERGWAYPWGDTPPPDCERAIFDASGDGTARGCDKGGTWPVCSLDKGRSAQGVCDLAGNVWEWVEDDYVAPYSTGAQTDPTAVRDSSASARVVRGGSWFPGARFLRAAYRYVVSPGYAHFVLGFRCVRDP